MADDAPTPIRPITPTDYTTADHLERVETLELNGYNDRLRAIAAETQLLAAQYQQKQSEGAQTAASRAGFVATLHNKYGLRQDIDTISATGQITRAPTSDQA